MGKFSAGKEGADKGHQAKSNNAMVLPTLTYGCEASTLQTRHRGRVEENADEDNEMYREGDKAG